MAGVVVRAQGALVGTFVVVLAVLIALLWVAIAVRRRTMRTYLLTTGTEVAGKAWLQQRSGRRAPRVAVQYTDSRGVVRTVLKSIISAGDAELVRKPVRVVFHPDRTTRDEYVLVGFGAHPATWFRVNFASQDVSS